MTSSKKRPLEDPDNSNAPPQKKQKLNLKKMWTRTNPETGKREKARLYRKTTMQLKQHRQRRKDEKQKKKKTTTTTVKKVKKAKKKSKTNQDEEDYSRFTTRFEGHVVVITGGGEAIGQAIAVRMAQEGAYVYILDHYKFNDTVELCEQYGRPPENVDDEVLDLYQGFKCDVSDIKQVQKCINQILEERGYIDVLVNAAFQHKGDGKIVEEVKSSDLNSVLKTNFMGTFNTCKLILPLMAKVNYGRVVNIVSHAGKTPKCGQFIEASASAAVIAGTKSMADDYARVNITCNVVTASYFEHEAWKLDKKDVKDLIPIGRNGELAEIAGLVAFVASEENAFSTGSVYDCSGGVNIVSN